MRLSQLRQKACFSLCIASAFLAVQLVGTAQQTVPFDGGIPVAPARFEPLPIPAEPLEFKHGGSHAHPRRSHRAATR